MATIEISSSQNGKLTRLYLGNIVIWFSYETPVAYRVPGIAGTIVSDKGWSQTTRRHIGSIEGRRAPIAHEDFERGLEAIMRAVESVERNAAILEISKLVTQADAAQRQDREQRLSKALEGTSPWGDAR